MITLQSFGFYRLFETKHGVRILRLGHTDYVWIRAEGIGDILTASVRAHWARNLLAEGQYRLYQIEAEPAYSDQMHLELLVGESDWQGYLLPSGLPRRDNRRVRVIATNETISGSRRISTALQAV